MRGAMDENDKFTSITILRDIEKRRTALNMGDGSTLAMLIQLTDDYVLRIRYNINQAKVDLKWRIQMAGLGMSTFPCTLCDAKKEDIRDPDKIKAGFPINRTDELAKELGELSRINPLGLSSKEILDETKGYKNIPLISVDAYLSAFDPLHCLISFGRWLKKIIIHENSGITEWAIEADLKEEVKVHEQIFSEELLRYHGINMKFELEGNSARTLFKNDNHELTMKLIHISDDKKKSLLEEFLNKIRLLLAVVSSQRPKEEFDMNYFGQHCIDLCLFMLEHFDYIRWPDYFHIATAHSKELIMYPYGPGSIGELSTEGKEAKNKIFMEFFTKGARMSSNKLAIRDVFMKDWLYTSPTLHACGTAKKVYRCKICNNEGHNRRTCPTLGKEKRGIFQERSVETVKRLSGFVNRRKIFLSPKKKVGSKRIPFPKGKKFTAKTKQLFGTGKVGENTAGKDKIFKDISSSPDKEKNVTENTTDKEMNVSSPLKDTDKEMNVSSPLKDKDFNHISPSFNGHESSSSDSLGVGLLSNGSSGTEEIISPTQEGIKTSKNGSKSIEETTIIYDDNDKCINKNPEEFLKAQNFSTVNVLGDGNCFFRALEMYSELNCNDLRKEIVDIVAQNKNLFYQFYQAPLFEQFGIVRHGDPNNLPERIKEMYKDKVYAGFIEKFAAAIYFRKNLVEFFKHTETSFWFNVYVSDTSLEAQDNWHKNENIYIRFFPNDEHFQSLINNNEKKDIPRLNNKDNIYFIYQMSADQPGIFEAVKPDELPTHNPYHVKKTDYKTTFVAGLINPRNFCYFNSLVQSISLMDIIRLKFVEYYRAHQLASLTNSITFNFGNLLLLKDEMNEKKDLPKLLEITRVLLLKIQIKTDKAYATAQSDPEEFFGDLLRSMFEELTPIMSLPGPTKLDNVPFSEFKESYLQNTLGEIIEPISLYIREEKHYEHHAHNINKSEVCKPYSCSIQPYSVYPLQVRILEPPKDHSNYIAQDSFVNIQDMIDEEIEKQYTSTARCPIDSCQKEDVVYVQKQSFIINQLPKYLIFRLTRYTMDQRRKTMVKTIGTQVKTGNYDAESQSIYINVNGVKYELKSCILHSGHSVYSGHYTNVLKKGNKYFVVNDEIVESIQNVKNSVMMKSNKNYLVFYEKCN